jgi:hypothetical protein
MKRRVEDLVVGAEGVDMESPYSILNPKPAETEAIPNPAPKARPKFTAGNPASLPRITP